MKNATTEVRSAEVYRLTVLKEEGDSLRGHLQDLKRREADILSQLRQTMEDVADTRAKLQHVNNEIARLS